MITLSTGKSLAHFQMSEFECPCCHVANMHESFLYKLHEARRKAGVAFIITSGYRCPQHNKDVGGSSTSSHLLGWAVDISAISDSRRHDILEALIAAEFSRIGIGRDFIHADTDPNKHRGVIWTYYKEEN